MTPNVLVLTGRITRADVPGLCARLEALVSGASSTPGASSASSASSASGASGASSTPGASGTSGTERVVVDCDVGGVVHPDLAVVEAVARLGLVARRVGGAQLRLRNVPAELDALLGLVGLTDAVETIRRAPE